MRLGRVSSRWELQLDDPSLQSDHCGVGSIVGAQFRKDVLDSTLDGFLRDGELIRNLLVRIPGCDQSQHGDFCGCQGVIRRMLGDFVRGLRGKGLLSAWTARMVSSNSLCNVFLSR